MCIIYAHQVCTFGAHLDQVDSNTVYSDCHATLIDGSSLSGDSRWALDERAALGKLDNWNEKFLEQHTLKVPI